MSLIPRTQTFIDHNEANIRDPFSQPTDENPQNNSSVGVYDNFPGDTNPTIDFFTPSQTSTNESDQTEKNPLQPSLNISASFIKRFSDSPNVMKSIDDTEGFTLTKDEVEEYHKMNNEKTQEKTEEKESLNSNEKTPHSIPLPNSPESNSVNKVEEDETTSSADSKDISSNDQKALLNPEEKESLQSDQKNPLSIPLPNSPEPNSANKAEEDEDTSSDDSDEDPVISGAKEIPSDQGDVIAVQGSESFQKAHTLGLKIFIALGLVFSHGFSLSIMGYGLLHILAATSLPTLALWSLATFIAIPVHRFATHQFSMIYVSTGEKIFEKKFFDAVLREYRISHRFFKIDALNKNPLLRCIC
jgi:hypothetical protein